jgi:hypothetical protein
VSTPAHNGRKPTAYEIQVKRDDGEDVWRYADVLGAHSGREAIRDWVENYDGDYPLQGVGARHPDAQHHQLHRELPDADAAVAPMSEEWWEPPRTAGRVTSCRSRATELPRCEDRRLPSRTPRGARGYARPAPPRGPLTDCHLELVELMREVGASGRTSTTYCSALMVEREKERAGGE